MPKSCSFRASIATFTARMMTENREGSLPVPAVPVEAVPAPQLADRPGIDAASSGGLGRGEDGFSDAPRIAPRRFESCRVLCPSTVGVGRSVQRFREPCQRCPADRRALALEQTRNVLSAKPRTVPPTSSRTKVEARENRRLRKLSLSDRAIGQFSPHLQVQPQKRRPHGVMLLVEGDVTASIRHLGCRFRRCT